MALSSWQNFLRLPTQISMKVVWVVSMLLLCVMELPFLFLFQEGLLKFLVLLRSLCPWTRGR